MNLSDREIAALCRCTVKDSKLYLPGITGEANIKRIGDFLRVSLQDSLIPHVKVISVLADTGGGLDIENFISKRSAVSKSYAELFITFKDLIFAELAGVREDQRQYGYLTTNGTVVNTDNNSIVVKGDSSVKTPKSLIKGLEIVRFNNGTAFLDMKLMKGTGNLSFDEVSDINYMTEDRKVKQYMPIAQYYNLTAVFGIRRYDPEEDDDCIQLMYKRDVNEDVLTEIFRNYGEHLSMGGF